MLVQLLVKMLKTAMPSVIYTALFSFSIAAAASDVVTLHSPAAGSLQLTPESYLCERLKITGHIDARDFVTLKKVTMSVTRELDLSEATIERYEGKSGSYSPITPDWIVGDGTTVDYPSGKIPVHAFTMVGDNSLYKWHYGSATLVKIILPSNTTGAMPSAFYKNEYLTEIEVPRFSTIASGNGAAVYNIDQTRLTGMAPVVAGQLKLPITLKSVADSVLNHVTVRGLEINAVERVEFGKQPEFNCAYILTPRPEFYTETFSGIDIFSELRETVVNNATPGTLMSHIAADGWQQEDVRNLTVNGEISNDDIYAMGELPHLHFLDLSNARFTEEELIIRNWETLCALQLPQGSYNLYIENCPFLGGELNVPEGVTYASCVNTPMLTTIALPSTLTELEPNSFNRSLISVADFSACTLLKELNALTGCQHLTQLQLPANLEVLLLTAPVIDIALPEKLQELSANNWRTTHLAIPPSLTKLSLSNLRQLSTIDFSQATSLTDIYELNNSPKLEEIDLTATPLKSIRSLTYTEHVPSALKTLRLPSTLQKMTSISGCRQLTELDLENCKDLSLIQEISDASQLELLRLPPDLKDLYTLLNCPKLTTISSAANAELPELGSNVHDTLLNKVTLIVPNGCTNSYRADSKWSKCKEIAEGGFTLRVKSQLDGQPANGSGLYAAGQTAYISVPDIFWTGMIKHTFNTWTTSSGNSFGKAEDRYTPTGHTTLTASYSSVPDLDRGDIVFTLQQSGEDEIQLITTGNSEDGMIIVYADNGDVVTGYDGYSISLPYLTGEHKYAVRCGQPSSIELISYSFEGKDKLTDFHISDPSRLEDISIESFTLAEFNPADYQQLKRLTLEWGGLDKIDVSRNKQLTSLDLAGNALQELDVRNNKDLYFLSCSSNKLTALDLSNNSNLVTLECDYNQLKSIDLSNKPELTNLSCGSNLLTTLNLSSNAKIESVDCSENYIRTLQLPSEGQLYSFNCSNNSFGFSQVNSTLYPRIVYSIEMWGLPACQYRMPAEFWDGSTLDLSSELFNAEGAPVSIKVTRGGSDSEYPGTDGKFALGDVDRYEVTMTCAAMPDLTFSGYFSLSQLSGIESLPLSNYIVNLNKGSIEIKGLEPQSHATCYTLSGKTVGTQHGTEIRFDRLLPGIYIVKLTENSRRTATLKLNIR